MALVKCPECGKEISDTVESCIHCGYVLEDEIAFSCPQCGEKILANEDAINTVAPCPWCEAKITVPEDDCGSPKESNSGKNGRWIAMSMVKCRECKKEVSSNADQCIHCGRKMRKSAGDLIWSALVFMGIIYLFRHRLYHLLIFLFGE